MNLLMQIGEILSVLEKTKSAKEMRIKHRREQLCEETKFSVRGTRYLYTKAFDSTERAYYMLVSKKDETGDWQMLTDPTEYADIARCLATEAATSGSFG